MKKDHEFLIWSNEQGRYWLPNGMGYTGDVESAGRFSLEMASTICREATPLKNDIPAETMVPSRSSLATEEKRAEIDTDRRALDLQIALDRSVKLQSHYASLLNKWDGGRRIGFDDGAAWIARLREIGELGAAESEASA
jgi:hypothetical protein